MRRQPGIPETLGLTVRIDRRCRNLVDNLLDACRSDVEWIREAMVTADTGTIEDLGHHLHFVGHGIGLGLISDVGSEIEDAARECDAPAIRSRVRVLQSFLQQVNVVSR